MTMRFAFCLLVCSLLGLAMPALPAHAQDDSKAVARTKLVEGSDLLKRGEYREALIRFQEAYALVPSPKILYNFGLAYMGLSRNADAIDAFEKFLNEAADAAPDLRANAERHRDTLLLQIGSLIIDANTDGAEISVDGRSRGLTPGPGAIRLDPGPHQLVVEKPGMPPYTRKMTIEAGQKLIVEVRLSKVEAPKSPQIIMMAPTPPPAPRAPETVLVHTWEWKVGIGVAAAAVAVLGFGVAERLSANSTFDKFNNHADTGQGAGVCDKDPRVLPMNGGADCTSLLNDGNSAASKATVGLIAGGVLAAGAVALLAVTWKDRVEVTKTISARQAPPSLALRCNPSLLQPGLSCALRF
ncbi:MAG TPA: PEGA domain-containing protein [Polyangia bacterium]|jgi:hypothetical protein|nr:PEGA domain-containing protein [Polyangia bacterium]